MSKWQERKAERNRQSVARLGRALPPIFPAIVLRRALGRPFVPPTPRLAIDSYWRAHPLRAERLARALAARSGRMDVATRQGAERNAGDIPYPASALSRKGLCARPWVLLPVRTTRLS